MTIKALDVTIRKADHSGRWIMGASARDRVDDTITPDAFKSALKKVGSKLIALWQHAANQPIGFWHNLEYKNGNLEGDLKLSTVNLATMVKQLLDDEVPLGASIGFQGLDGAPNEFGGIEYTDISLLETSIVSVPAQPAAIRIAKHFGIPLDRLSIERDHNATSGDNNNPINKQALETVQRARKVLARSV